MLSSVPLADRDQKWPSRRTTPHTTSLVSGTETASRSRGLNATSLSKGWTLSSWGTCALPRNTTRRGWGPSPRSRHPNRWGKTPESQRCTDVLQKDFIPSTIKPCFDSVCVSLECFCDELTSLIRDVSGDYHILQCFTGNTLSINTHEYEFDSRPLWRASPAQTSYTKRGYSVRRKVYISKNSLYRSET